MSRAWRADRSGFVPKSHRKPGSAPWKAACEARAQRRKGLTEQPRDPQGFILKEVDGHTVCYDPGAIDRFLWCLAHGKGD